VSLGLALGTWIVATAYLGLLESRRGRSNGQTPGKGNQGIRTVRARDGLPIGRTRAWMRAGLLGLLLPAGYPVEGVGRLIVGPGFQPEGELFWAVTGFVIAVAVVQPKRRTLFDWLCGTAVVEEIIVAPDATAAEPQSPLIGRPLERGVLALALFASSAGCILLLAPAPS